MRGGVMQPCGHAATQRSCGHPWGRTMRSCSRDRTSMPLPPNPHKDACLCMQVLCSPRSPPSLGATCTQVLRSPRPPPVLAAHFDQTLYLKTRAYSLDKWWFALWQGIYSFAETMLMLTYKV